MARGTAPARRDKAPPKLIYEDYAGPDSSGPEAGPKGDMGAHKGRPHTKQGTPIRESGGVWMV